ncbi:protein translocase subunit SecD [Candidatus Roizmanbacteria bacterium]|nr:protein translocase subunit SecD [Candidatus Roizmanbacteria bacterium]
MKILKTLFLISVTVFIILIDLPENLKIGKYVINPLSLDFPIFGLRVKKDFKTKLGLDLKGGSHLVFEADTKKIKPEDLQDALSSSRDIIEKRVNFFGVSEPSVQTLKSGNNYRISVDLPGIENVSEAIGLIGRTALLTFKEQDPQQNVASASSVLSTLTKDTGLTGKHIKKSSVTFDSQTGKPQVALTFSTEGGKLFADVTKRNIGKPVAIVIDNFLISAPTVQQAILDGSAVITGDFTVEDAKKLAIAINSGALPLSINLVEQKNIGPTLGKIEVQKSVYAGAIGLFAVLVFMILYYGKLGMIASLALIIYGLISFAIFRTIPVVLTLPGVAGFILSIGMAVDSNILIFERIKEEMRRGKEFDIAFRLGFGRAIDTIKDANITTLTVAFILFNPLNWEFLPQFGMVRGFALTLAIGVATSLFTGVVITKRLIEVFYKK